MTLQINEARLRYVTTNPAGPVGRHLARTGARIESVAKALATSEQLVRTGRYRSSIAWTLINEGTRLVLRVGSALPYARVLEHGSPPHTIRARNKRALWWDMPNDRGWMVQPDHGRPVPSVQHPGGRPYLVLRRAVESVLRRP